MTVSTFLTAYIEEETVSLKAYYESECIILNSWESRKLQDYSKFFPLSTLIS